MTEQIAMDVYCLVPYRPEARCKLAPPPEPAFYNREVVLAFKNGRAMNESQGGVSFRRLTRSIVTACQGSPLAQNAKDTVWVPVPRSGQSKPSFDPRGDKYPCHTLASQLAIRLGGTAIKVLEDGRHFAPKKHDVEAGVKSLTVATPVPESRVLVLIDDTFVTGATLTSCAIVLRDHGYAGTIAAFCVGYDVDLGDAAKEQCNKTWRRLTWSLGSKRPAKTPTKIWEAE